MFRVTTSNWPIWVTPRGTSRITPLIWLSGSLGMKVELIARSSVGNRRSPRRTSWVERFRLTVAISPSWATTSPLPISSALMPRNSRVSGSV
ncbi:hypothetical protein D3C84_1026790 [compost metagenome]